VTIDGVATDTFMLSPAYLGVVVPGGSHLVIARYEPVPTKMPLLVFGLLVLAAAVPASRKLRGVAWA